MGEVGRISFKILSPIGKSYSSETYKIDLHARKVRPKEGRKIAQVNDRAKAQELCELKWRKQDVHCPALIIWMYSEKSEKE